MANILESNYISNGFNQNSTQYDIVVSLDDTIAISTINSCLPNNGDRYATLEHINTIPTGSTSVIYTPQEMIICVFVSSHGTLNSTTGMKTGMWYCIGKKSYVTT
jgi:hypothetical protein